MNNLSTDSQDLSEKQPEYEDTVEGMLQYRADLSLWYTQQIKDAKTSLKRELYTKKLKKNNNKIYKLLVRTPNAYNPFIQYLETAATNAEEGVVEPANNAGEE